MCAFNDDSVIGPCEPVTLTRFTEWPPKGDNCRTGCPTRDHVTWGECARAANLRVAYCGIGGGDASEQKRWDQELSLYRSARAQGVQPDGTKTHQIEAALRASEAAGAAYGKDFGAAAPMPADTQAV